MHKKVNIYLLIISSIFFNGCNPFGPKWATENFSSDSTLVHRYLKIAEDIKQTDAPQPEIYADAMLYFDSALQVAQVSENDYLLAKSYNGMGIAYDAWNHAPQKTTQYFLLSLKHHRKYKKQPYQEKYTRFLLAHTFMKQSNYSSATAHLDTLYNEIKALPDGTKRLMDFSILIARTYAFSSKFQKAEQCIKDLTKREWIKNNPSSYNFLNYYFLIKAQTDVLYYQKKVTPYLDSTLMAFREAKNLGEITYLGGYLRDLYRHIGNVAMADKVSSEIKLSVSKVPINENNALTASEKIGKINTNHIQADIATKAQQLSTLKKLTLVITILALTIGALAIYLRRSNNQVNAQKEILDKNIIESQSRNQEIELLNKEIHHRVKNNLQIMQSLMLIQEKKSNNVVVSEIMKEMRIRINNMANMHQQLLEQNENINLNDYVHLLTQNAISLLSGPKSIMANLDIENIKLSHKKIFALGLILNEWITNTAKYAHTDDGTIIFDLSVRNQNSEIAIEFFDNGVPVKTEVRNGMGLSIIDLLIKQIYGNLSCAENNSLHYYLTIPKYEH
jgi:two-component sensor histidine kinase